MTCIFQCDACGKQTKPSSDECLYGHDGWNRYGEASLAVHLCGPCAIKVPQRQLYDAAVAAAKEAVEAKRNEP